MDFIVNLGVTLKSRILHAGEIILHSNIPLSTNSSLALSLYLIESVIRALFLNQPPQGIQYEPPVVVV